MNAILQDLPLPERLVPWPKASPTTLTRCLLLALLLHLWLVLWLGNAPGGTAPVGQGVFGAINVTLRGPPTALAPAAVVVPPAPANARPGEAATPRWGGAVRSVEPQPDSAPGAARLGSSRLPVKPERPVEPLQVPKAQVQADLSRVPSPAAAPEPEPEPLLPSPPSPGRVLQERRLRAREPAPISEPLPRPTAAPPIAMALPELPAPNAVIAVAKPVLQRVLPQGDAPAPAPVSPLPRSDLAVTAPQAPSLPSIADAAAPLRRLDSQPLAERAPQPALATSGEISPIVLPAPAAVSGLAMPAANTGPADAAAQVGHDVATPPAAAASAAPRLNLQLARPRGGELSRYGTHGVLPLLPRLPERDDKLAREIEKAAKTDCRQAYSGMGPLAVIPLALDAVRKDGGCKW